MTTDLYDQHARACARAAEMLLAAAARLSPEVAEAIQRETRYYREDIRPEGCHAASARWQQVMLDLPYHELETALGGDLVGQAAHLLHRAAWAHDGAMGL